MTHGTIRNDDFERNRVLQHSCDIVVNCHNTVPTLLPTKSSLQIVSCDISLNLSIANNYKPILSFKNKHCSVTKPKHECLVAVYQFDTIWHVKTAGGVKFLAYHLVAVKKPGRILRRCFLVVMVRDEDYPNNCGVWNGAVCSPSKIVLGRSSSPWPLSLHATFIITGINGAWWSIFTTAVYATIGRLQ